jgi:crotonobetainyl-CoA:carnitine CoA-transferase CaiB-like acyl-CoA transferase
MGKVIAGAGIGRALALHGADVLNLWRPTELEHETVYYSANVGVRSALLDPHSDDGRERLSELLRDADVFYHNRRLPPIMVVNDYIVPWLTTMGITRALIRRAEEGSSYRVHVSLTRVALWLLSLGIFDQQWAHATAGAGEQHAYLAPET